MAVALRSESHISEGAGSGSTIVGSEPAGAASGDFIMAFAYWEGTTLSSPPAGWTTLFLQAYPSGATVFWSWIGIIFRGGSAPSYTLTMAGTPTWQALYVLALTGVDTTLPVNAFQWDWGAATGTANDPPSWWPEVEDSYLLAVEFNQPGFQTTPITTPSGYTQLTGNGAANPDICVAGKQAVGFPRLEDPSTWMVLIGSGPKAFCGIALTPSGGVRRSRDQAGPMELSMVPSIVVPGAGV